jgi:hypothetical protein
MIVNNKIVQMPKYDKATNKWLCPSCRQEVDIYNEDNSYYWNECECGCLVATRNYMEEKYEGHN